MKKPNITESIVKVHEEGENFDYDFGTINYLHGKFEPLVTTVLLKQGSII